MSAGDDYVKVLRDRAAAWKELARRERVNVRKLREANHGLAIESEQRWQANIRMAEYYRALAKLHQETQKELEQIRKDFANANFILEGLRK